MKLTSSRAALTVAGLALTLVVGGCASDTDVNQGGDQGGADAAAGGSIAENYDLSGKSFTVGSKEFTEARILGQMTIAALEAAGAQVTDKTGISGSATVRAALESGEIDMSWDYTGTGWVNYLGHTTNDLPDDLFAAVQEQDAANDITWIGPSELNNAYGLAVKQELAEAEGIASISDLAEYVNANPDQNTICAASEFLQRDDGLPGLQTTYGVTFAPVELELSLVYTQVGSQCVTAEVFQTDARVAANELRALDDDQDFFVPYNGALMVRSELVADSPEIEELFGEIADALDNEKMMALNGMVDIEGETESDTARQFLTDEGFIS